MDREEIKEQINIWLTEECKKQDWELNYIENDSYYYGCEISVFLNKKIDSKIEKSKSTLCNVLIEKDIERVILFNHMKFTKHDEIGYKLSIEKTKFWFDLRLNTMLLGVGILPIPNMENLDLIQLQKTIYFDGWSRDRLMNDFFKIKDASDLVGLLFGKFRDYMSNKINQD